MVVSEKAIAFEEDGRLVHGDDRLGEDGCPPIQIRPTLIDRKLCGVHGRDHTKSQA